MIGVWAGGLDLELGVEPGDLKLSRMGLAFWRTGKAEIQGGTC